MKDYPDVFLEKLPGMPPDRDIEFLIELLPGTGPISKRPHRMPANDLEEIKKQIKELLEKGYIRWSSSPWGAPVLLVDTSILHHDFILIFIALWVVLTHYVTILMPILSYLQGLHKEEECRQLGFWAGKGANIRDLFCTTPKVLKLHESYFWK